MEEEWKPHKQGQKYKNKKDRRRGMLEAKKRYARKPWECKPCKIIILSACRARHLKTKKHLSNAS